MGTRKTVAAKRVKEVSAFPKHLTWLVKILTFAYGSKVLILSMIGDIAKLIRRRHKQPKNSNTTCICCGGWIPKEREERHQHTCSENCQNWYRILTRAIDAEKSCRYCGHGLPKEGQKHVLRRRPARPGPLVVKSTEAPQKGYGAARQTTLKSFKVGDSVPLRPTGDDSRPFVEVKEQVESHLDLLWLIGKNTKEALELCPIQPPLKSSDE